MTTDQAVTTPKRKRRWLRLGLPLMLLVVLCSLPCWWLTLAIRAAHEAARTCTCSGRRIGMLGLALQNYHDVYHRFPPAFIADKHGKPIHSWRVLVLRFLDEDLYCRYDFSEPWNGPKNRTLWKEMPTYFRCPSYSGQNPYSTSYVAVIAPTTVWPGGKGVAQREVTDGASNTVMLVEVADSDINWMEPRDMTLAKAVQGVNVDRQHGISSNHPGGASGLMADTFNVFLPDDASPAAIKALLTIHGDEPWELVSPVLSRQH